MAQWSRADRTLHTKLVYYGPAFGGKTTNLESLYRLTDPDKKNQLLSVQTVKDRTLFFDLLPFELGDILGYQVAMKIYTVPGQVRYDTTRQVVLAGADAIVFVADSSSDRKDQNVWSLQNLRMNMRAKRLDPKRVPVLFQFNKQDLPCAAPLQQVAKWLGIPAKQGTSAVATEGRGVLETLTVSCKRMLEQLILTADSRTRRHIDAEELSRQVDRAFSGHVARSGEVIVDLKVKAAAAPPRGSKELKESTRHSLAEPRTAVALEGDALLERSVETSVKLGERLTSESARAARLESEADAFRRLSDSLRSVGASLDRGRIVEAALETIHGILDAPVVSLFRENAPGHIEQECVLGRESDPLASSAGGHSVLQRMLTANEPSIVDGILEQCPGDDAEHNLAGLQAAVGVPVEAGDTRATIVVYAAEPDGRFNAHDVRFIGTVAGHLAAGLEKARLHEDLAHHRDALEAAVLARTEQLRDAYRSLRELEEMKDRFLGNLSHEMKTPLTAILSAAHVIRDYKSTAKERRELVGSIITSAETLERQLANLFRMVNLEQGDRPLRLEEATPQALVEEAIQVSERSGVQFKVEEIPGPFVFDRKGLARAMANLIDNAVKFSPSSGLVRIAVKNCRLAPGPGMPDAVSLSVFDRGPGVSDEDLQRIFLPFEQGGDPLTEKPRGIGIGLYEARKMAERHGGTVEYLPREGGGSEFRLTVPLCSQPDGSTSPAVDDTLEVTRA